MSTIRGVAIILTAISIFVASSSAQPIRVQSTDMLSKLNQHWAEAYRAKHSEVKIEIGSGLATNAFVALSEKKADLAVVPRAMRFKEAQMCEQALGQRPTEFKLAVNAVAIYVSAGNPVKRMTYDEIAAIFQGKYRDWKKLDGDDAPIVALGVATNTPIGELFVEEVLAGKSLSNDVRILDGPELLKAIAQDKNAIGFGQLVQSDGVRALEIKRVFSSTPVAPDEDTISNRIYPISRFVYGYADSGTMKDELKSCLDWIRSDEGQWVAKEAGYFAVAAKWR